FPRLKTQPKNMNSRPNSGTVTVQHERFAWSGVAPRSTEPEVFTFERIPARATAVRSYVPIRPKKRCARVMYPAKVRMHLPPPERSRAKRWLAALCLVLLWQIYTEEPCAEAPLSSADGAGGDCQAFPLQAAEERALQLLSTPETSCEDGPEPPVPDTGCAPAAAPQPESGRALEQSAGKSYMVALLVYHRLGSDN
uniref:Radiation-inducible immediate-early gene IEX-1 n=1 Tax=Salarias fasciatus TaxID=181472 RepID=A0A672GDU2_SALFA